MVVNRPLHVGVVGLGDIAHKAYLPVLAARDDVVLSVATRDEAVRARAAARYRTRGAYRDVAGLLDGERLDAALVHAATDAHAGIVEPLLRAGVPVLVDKPLAPSQAEAAHLVRTAEAHGVSLAVGFNRRYAPAYAALVECDRSVVLMSKHRVGLPDQPRRVVFDDLVHVIDTLRFLLPDPGQEELVSVRCTGARGLLSAVTVVLASGSATAIGVMNRQSGASEEVVEVLGNGHRTRVLNLGDTSIAQAGQDPRVRRRDDWSTVETQRGFTALCDHFLTAVRDGEVLSARDALRTHEVCEQVVATAREAVT